MESDSQPASSLEFVKTFVVSNGKRRKQTPINFANILGGAIALITLVSPLLAIARYSPSQVRDFKKLKSPNVKIVLLGCVSLHPTYGGIIFWGIP